ncbi:hypothetical protein ANO11243_004600 [Dothideomycetidae sp. 11243]|nr:hypothetical protein ANO11243_004600 [fungal sp. No.11243]
MGSPKDTCYEVLCNDDTCKEVYNRISVPISFVGIDISSLDARDVPGLSSVPPTPLPCSVSSPTIEDRERALPGRARARSMLSGLKPVKSMGRLRESMQRIAQQARPESRASSRVATSSRSTPRRPPARTSPYSIKAGGSTPELVSFGFPQISGPIAMADSSVFAIPIEGEFLDKPRRLADSMRSVSYEAVGPEAVRSAKPGAAPGLPDKHSIAVWAALAPPPAPPPAPVPAPPLSSHRRLDIHSLPWTRNQTFISASRLSPPALVTTRFYRRRSNSLLLRPH